MTPLRIEYHASTVLEVVKEGMENASNKTSGYNSPAFPAASPPIQSFDATIGTDLLPPSRFSTAVSRFKNDNLEDASQHVDELSIKDTHPTSNSLVTYPAVVPPDSQHLQLYNPSAQAILDGQERQITRITALMDQHFEKLQIEVAKNTTFQKQIHHMQLEMDKKQQQIISMQQQMEEKQKEMIQLQKQTLDRLAIIQNRVQAVLTQTYELHEYPIPRLFIILPKPTRRRDIFGKLFADQFQLFFLCECGKHTMPKGSTDPHEIHLAKHEGYDIAKPREFFEKYGTYILTLMHMFKYGIVAAGVVVPSLDAFKVAEGMNEIQKFLNLTKDTMGVLVDDAISFLEGQQNNSSDGIETTGGTGMDSLEALEGAELRQLESYLTTKDSSRILGNLYRTVTSEGHVKWVCIDHYRENYREKAIQDLRQIIEANEGTFVEEIGRIDVRFYSRTLAKEFYDAMIKARGIQMLEIWLQWDVTMDDLRSFADSVTKASISHLKINGYGWDGPALDVVNRLCRYDPIAQLGSNGRIQSLAFGDFSDFSKRMSNPSMIVGPQLRILKIEESINSDNDYGFLSSILGACRHLTELHLVTNRLKDTVECIVKNLGSLHTVSSTHLGYNCTIDYEPIYQDSGVVKDLTLNLQKSRKVAPASSNRAPATMSEAPPKSHRPGLTVSIKTLVSDDPDLLSFYSNYDWPIEDLHVRDLSKDDLKTLDKLTERSVPKRLFMQSFSPYGRSSDDIQHLERIVERSPVVEAL
ncbi:hypothetical protein BGX27_009879, partial [Mortierella sp. AM989]